jgi:hypothetical protein
MMFPGGSLRQCRERWSEYLNPDLRTDPWTDDEDDLLLRQIELSGNRWTAIAASFDRRSANDIKNRWYTHLRSFVFRTIEGKLEFYRGFNGERLRAKSRHKKRSILPNPPESPPECPNVPPELPHARVWLPQLCTDDVERLMIGSQNRGCR